MNNRTRFQTEVEALRVNTSDVLFCGYLYEKCSVILKKANMKNVCIVIFIFLTIEDIFSLKDCPNNCLCIEEEQNISIDCPLEDLSIELTISLNQEARMTCFNSRMLDLKFNLENITSLYLKNCELPKNFTEKLKITRTEVIFLEDSKVWNGIIDKNFFGGLSKPNLKRLYIKNGGINYIDEEAFEGFDNLEILDFEQNFISKIPDFFKYLPNLEVIDLQQNAIDSLPGVIRAPKLLGLHLRSNNLQNLTSNIFSLSPNIRILDISANKLINLPEDLLHPLKDLSTLLLGLDGQFNLTSKFFQENQNLESIRFCGGSIIDISKDAFNNLPKISNISFYDTKLTHLRLGTFDKTVNLDTLLLGENKISSLPEGVFKALSNLTKLDLSGNKLTKWTRKYYNEGLQQLKSLDLGGNNLQEIDDGSFSDMVKLETLILRGNKIKKISMYAFGQGSSLTYLDLSSNKLKGENQELFNYLTQLKQLNLDDNFYDRIPEVTSANCTLSIKNNNLTTLYMSSILNYGFVSLSNNKIKHVSFELVHYMLEEGAAITLKLEINNNPIVCDCHLLQLVKYFEGTFDPRIKKSIEIETGDTECYEPAHLKHTPVKNLTLADLTCKHDDCPDGCACSVFPANNTLEIDCSNLNLTEPPRSIGFAPFDMSGFQIRKCAVNLKNNRIEEFVENDDYENVTMLLLGNNNLSDVSWLPGNIEVLELSNNSLRSLNDSVVSFLENSQTLVELALHDNPWRCDCSLLSFAKAVKGCLSRKLENKHELLCDNGDNLNNISEVDLCKKDPIIAIILYGFLILFLSSLAVLMVLYHMYEQPVTIWLRNRNNFLFKTEEQKDVSKEFDAFVSYSLKDEEFVEKYIVKKLEKEDPFKLCIPNRDWDAGEIINKKIIESIEQSRKTIILLSKNWIVDEFRIMEFRTAHQQGIRDRVNRIILIIYDDLDLHQIQDKDLNAYIRSTTYVKWGDPWFWEKIREAMPRKKW